MNKEITSLKVRRVLLFQQDFLYKFKEFLVGLGSTKGYWKQFLQFLEDFLLASALSEFRGSFIVQSDLKFFLQVLESNSSVISEKI